MTLGEKIQALRKQQGLSQEALAEKMMVTRQTISKWELDRSAPDLELLARLSELFGVSTDYLIKEELAAPAGPPPQKRSFRISERGKRAILALLSAAALVAVWVCLICDYFTAEGKTLSWSLIVAAAILAAWVVALPLLAAKTKVLFKTLLAASAVPIPLLAVLALLLHRPLVFAMGACIALIALAAAWVIYGIFYRCRKNLWRAFGWALLVMVPVPVAIDRLVGLFMPQVQNDPASGAFNSGMTLALALALFGVDYLSCRKKEGPQG